MGKRFLKAENVTFEEIDLKDTICRFFIQLKRSNGKEYKLKTYRFKNSEFEDIKNTVENRLKEIIAAGNCFTSHYQDLKEAEQTKLMEYLRLENPKHLTIATVMVVGIHFCLRGQEIADLALTQIHFGHIDGQDFIEYVQGECKNNKATIGVTNFEPKTVKLFPFSDSPKDPYLILSKYWKFRSELPTNPDNRLFRSFKKKNFTGNPLTNQAIKAPTLRRHLQELCKKVNINKKIGLHSFRVTCVSRLYNQGIQDQEIMKLKSGHKSESSLQLYKRVCLEKEKAIDNALQLKLDQKENNSNQNLPLLFPNGISIGNPSNSIISINIGVHDRKRSLKDMATTWKSTFLNPDEKK
ncbi:hypothetical protein M0811_11767 [Anaeramoeba ignava]|uniref:Tyr recombinase domain-containing protein n=1 Tax=Anaeramoeba ignava TaxID=1746090 RepID=A0A9Q0R6N8_ANAIG|nr:hypothetical protein M0811_11767 [Anaeramoeba ignava]